MKTNSSMILLIILMIFSSSIIYTKITTKTKLSEKKTESGAGTNAATMTSAQKLKKFKSEKTSVKEATQGRRCCC